MPRYFVTYQDPASLFYEAINSTNPDRSFTATSGVDANGLAALSTGKSGKYVSYPVDGPQNASFLTVCTAAESNILYTSKVIGPNGALIRIRYVVAGNNTSLSVSVSGNDITVNVATNGSGVATSTATQVKAAVDGSGPASALVSTALSGLGTGVVNAFGYTNLQDGSPQASLIIDLATANADMLFTAQAQGTTGNLIRVAVVVAGNNTSLSVGVSGNDVTINSATNGGGTATTTAAQAIAAVNASAAASALVLAQTAPNNDGSGIISAAALTYLTGGQYGGAVATTTTVAFGAQSIKTTY